MCWFAHRKQGSTATVALLGDSHASSWRSAVRGARALAALARADAAPLELPVQRGAAHQPAEARAPAARQWVRATIRWFGKHPEIHTVIVTGSAYSGVVAPAGGRTSTQTAVDGYRAALAALPRERRSA